MSSRSPSPPLSPNSGAFVDSLLCDDDADDFGAKRLRPPIQAESLLPLEDNQFAAIPIHGSASISFHSPVSCVLDTCVVHGTQNTQDSQQLSPGISGGGAAGPATDAAILAVPTHEAESELDESSDEGPSNKWDVGMGMFLVIAVNTAEFFLQLHTMTARVL
jgi:hypothetical protein